MKCIIFVLMVALVCAATSLPLEPGVTDADQKEVKTHSLRKRFVNPMFAFGESGESWNSGLPHMRTRRQADEECEKLELCKLHARSHHNFLAAFELYFVNRENAREWDHQSRSLAECESRFGDCYEK